MRMKSFAMLEFLVGLIVFAIISIVCVKLAFYAKRQEVVIFNLAYNFLEIQNALMQISRLLDNASKIILEDSKLIWYDEKNRHEIFFDNQTLFLDGFIMLEGIFGFEVRKIKEDILLKICGKKSCLMRMHLRYGDMH
ncbi:hypothetical protein LW135_05970 [Helicobacter sp. faydin-H20]|nr:hypothetical protein [Helicobacter anatolicus]